MKRVIVLLIAAFAVLSAGAQIVSVKGPSHRILQYEEADFTVTLKGTWNNPYLQEEACLDMILTAPSGATLTLPCS